MEDLHQHPTSDTCAILCVDDHSMSVVLFIAETIEALIESVSLTIAIGFIDGTSSSSPQVLDYDRVPPCKDSD